MKLTVKRYTLLLCVQFACLVADLMFNTFIQYFVRQRTEFTIFMFVTQDALIVVEYLLFSYALHKTCVYEVGASHVILRNCKFFLFTILTYFLCTALQHFTIIYNIWYPLKRWTTILSALSLIQRLIAVFYYYTFKRTALTFSDPRYYEENIDWIAEQLVDKLNDR